MNDMSRKEAIRKVLDTVLWTQNASEDNKNILTNALAKALEPTTKNDLGVEKDLVSSIIEKISEQVTETREEFIFETIRPYCENVVQMKISKRDLEQALLKYYGKNDLGVDAVSRADARSLICDIDLKHHTFGMSRKAFKDLYNGMDELPSVTPIRPKGHWIGHREHCENLGVMPSGLGAYEWCSNCDCGIDVRAWHRNHYNYCPNCGCRMVEPQESEKKE